MAEKQNLESRIFFSSNPGSKVNEFEARDMNAEGELKVVGAVIISSFFGGLPGPKDEIYYGLNVTVELEATQDAIDFHSRAKATARYSKMGDIEGLMEFYGVRVPEQLEGKSVKAYFAKIGRRKYLVALATLKQEEIK